MGRTTTEKKGNTVILRISDELKGQLEEGAKKEEVSVSEYIRGILESKKGSGGKCNTKKSEPAENNVIQKEQKGALQEDLDEKRYKDLERMCQLSGLSIGKFMEYIIGYFNSGRIYIDGIVVKTKGKYDTLELEEVCHRVNADPQEMIDRLTKSLMRG